MKIKSLEASEKDHLMKVLQQTHWDLDKTARLLQIPLPDLKSKIKRYALEQPDSQES